MALQGTIDAFPLTDVLQLLSSSKTGRLVLDGDRGRAELWIESGDVVGTDAAARSGDGAELVFELLRFSAGSFVFESADPEPAIVVEAVPLAECVVTASGLLEEWRRIEAVVPSPAHRVVVAPELADDEVTLSSQDWRVLAAAGDGPSVELLGQRLGLGEYAAGAALAQLVERALVVVEQPPAQVPDELPADPSTDARTADEASDTESSEGVATSLADGEAFPEHFPIDDLLDTAPATDGAWDVDDEAHRFAAAQTFEPLSGDAFGDPAFGDPAFGDPAFDRDAVVGGAGRDDVTDRTAEAWDDVVAGTADAGGPWPASPEDAASVDETADEVLRQMSRLSPKAAEAIAAALNSPAGVGGPGAGTGAESDRGDGEGPVSFMGSF